MKFARILIANSLNLSLIIPVFFVAFSPVALGQDVNGAMHRGYRTGYSDGYMAGYRDSIDTLASDITRHREYESADRAYSKDYGTLEDYRDGYRQGFQKGYSSGFEKKTFDSTAPTGLSRVGSNSPIASPIASGDNAAAVNTASAAQQTEQEITSQKVDPTASPDISVPSKIEDTTGDSASKFRNASFRTDDGSITIPKGTDLLIELQEALTTQSTRQGERFTAKVVSPMELDGAIVEGHIEKIQIPGRLKRTAELQLSFDRIVLPDGRWANFDGMLTEINAINGDNIRRVTDEGTAIGQSSVKGDVIKIGGATGAGAGVGAIVGGPVGAAVGAGIGAALGIGAAVTDRGKHINLTPNQQLKVRAYYDTKIR